MKQEATFQGKAALIGYAQVATAMTSAPVDRLGFEYAVILINCGVLADAGAVVVNIQDSATSGGTYATLVSHALVTTADDNTTIMGLVRLHGAKRFIRAAATVNASGSGNHTVLVTALLHPGQYTPEDNLNSLAFVYEGPGPGASNS